MAVCLPLLYLLVMRSRAGITVANRESHMWWRTVQCLMSQLQMENGREVGSGFWVSDDYKLFPEEKEDGGGQVSRDTWLHLSPHKAHLLDPCCSNICRDTESFGNRTDSPISAGREIYQDLDNFIRIHTHHLCSGELLIFHHYQKI